MTTPKAAGSLPIFNQTCGVVLDTSFEARENDQVMQRPEQILALALATLLALALGGCEEIPNHNLGRDPISIAADGQDYITCGAYSLTNDSFLGEPSYTIIFTNAADGKSVTLRGVRKVTIMEMPTMVDAPMPTYLPNVQTDRASDGSRYVEGLTYTWPDGSKAMVKNGTWAAVKQRNTICDTPK